MPELVDQMLAELGAAMGAMNVPVTSKAAADFVYETYVFSLVIAAAAEAGATVSYQDRDGNDVKDLVLRASPGAVHARGRRFTHAVLQFGSAPPLETHLRVKVSGRSGSPGECDVLLLGSHAAAVSRHKQELPRGGSCVLAIECKFYVSPLPVEAAVGFHGRCDDRQRMASLFVANRASPSTRQFLWNKPWLFELTVMPGNRQVAHVKSMIRDILKRHVAHYDPAFNI